MHGNRTVTGSSCPLVSVVLPVFNVERYVIECLDSIASQDYPNFEVIAVDDGSSDGSLRLLEEYASSHSAMAVLHQENSGAGVARNKGIAAAKGKYVLFVDPDDAIEPCALRELVEVAESKSAEIVLFSAARYDAELKTLVALAHQPRQAIDLPEVFAGSDMASNIYTTFSDGPAPWNKLFLRQFITNHGLSFQSLPRVNDLSFSYSALALAKRICVIDKAYYRYRTNRKGSSQNTTDHDPAPVCAAYLRLRETLSKADVFAEFSASFYKAFFASCSYTFHQMKRLATARRLFDLLHSESMASIAGVKLDRDSFKTDKEFAAYVGFWKEQSPCRLMLTPRQRRFADEMPALPTSVNGKVLGIMCGSLRPGGIERVVTHLVPMFVENGFGVVLMTSAPPTAMEYELPAGCIRLTTGLDSEDRSRYDRIRAAILMYGIDTVIAHEYYMLTIGRDIAAIHSAGAHAVVHHHSIFSNMYLRDARERALPQLIDAYSSADAMITLSDIDADFFGLMGCKTFKIVDPVPDIPPRGTKKSSGHTLIWAARFVGGKRPLDAVKIFERVHQKVADAKLVMLGDGHAAQKKLVDDYLASRPELGKAVARMGHQPDVFAFERNADVFLTTTEFDGFSLSIIEAKAMGLPVVTYSMPYLETVQPGTGVLSVPQRDVAAAADAVVRIFNDEALRTKLSVESRASYEHFAALDQWAAYSWLFEMLDGKGALPERDVKCESARIIVKTLLNHVDMAMERIAEKSGKMASPNLWCKKDETDVASFAAADYQDALVDAFADTLSARRVSAACQSRAKAMDAELAKRDARINELLRQRGVRDARINELEERVAAWKRNASSAQKRVDELLRQRGVRDAHIAELEARIAAWKGNASSAQKRVEELLGQRDVRDARVVELEQRVEAWKRNAEEARARGDELLRQRGARDERIAELERRLEAWKKNCAEKDVRIERLLRRHDGDDSLLKAKGVHIRELERRNALLANDLSRLRAALAEIAQVTMD